MFPNLFQKVDKKIFHCDTREFAKYKCVDFPSSNKRMIVPFASLHSYVWGPFGIPNLLGACWFLIFIDHTQVSCVFLLKQKKV